MRIRPYPIAVQEAAIARIRAGETLTAVKAALHVDETQLSRDLRHAYPDFQRIMDANSRKFNASRAKPKHTSRPKRTKGWTFPRDRRGPLHDQAPALTEQRLAEMNGRRVTDPDELAVLQKKIAGYVASGRCRIPSYKVESLREG